MRFRPTLGELVIVTFNNVVPYRPPTLGIVLRALGEWDHTDWYRVLLDGVPEVVRITEMEAISDCAD